LMTVFVKLIPPTKLPSPHILQFTIAGFQQR